MNYWFAIVFSIVCHWSKDKSTATAYYHNSHNNKKNDNQRWLRSELMDGNGLYILDWRFDEKDIFFRVTVNTRGFIGLGFSTKKGEMAKADLVLAWVDDRTGQTHVLVRLV